MANKSRETANLVSSKTGIAVTISGDPVILGVGNTQHVRVTGGGYIGIGTDTPATKLHLTDDSITIEHTTPSVIYRRSSDKTDIVTQQYHVADEAFYTWAKNKDISFSSSLDKGIDYPHLFIKTTTGRVGILTNNPTDNLQIGGADSTVGQTPKVLSLRHGTVPAYLSASHDGTHYITNLSSNIYDSSNGSQSWSSFGSTAFAAAAIRLECDTNDSDIRFYTATTDNTTPSERMAIFHDGKIGFGTDAITSGIPYTFVHPTNGSAGGGAILQVATHGNSDLYLSLGAQEIVAGSGSDGMSYIRAGSGGSLNNGLIFEVAISGTETEVARITSDTNPYFRLSSSCAGIQFNGEVSADDTLDHYEEGTWTPDLRFDASNTGITYSSGQQYGTYTRIGSMVFCRFMFVLSSKGAATGTPRIYGLPFTVKDALTGTSLEGEGRISWFDNKGAESGIPYIIPFENTTYAAMYTIFEGASVDSASATQAIFENNSSVRGYVWYYV